MSAIIFFPRAELSHFSVDLDSLNTLDKMPIRCNIKLGIAFFEQTNTLASPRWAIVLTKSTYQSDSVSVHSIFPNGSNGDWYATHDVNAIRNASNLIGIVHVAGISPLPPFEMLDKYLKSMSPNPKPSGHHPIDLPWSACAWALGILAGLNVAYKLGLPQPSAMHQSALQKLQNLSHMPNVLGQAKVVNV